MAHFNGVGLLRRDYLLILRRVESPTTFLAHNVSMIKVSLYCGIAIAAAFCAGCKSGTDVTGTWKGALTVDAANANDPSVKLAQSMMKDVTLDLKKDKTYSLTMGFPMEGTWDQNGNTVNLKATKVMGMDVAKIKEAAMNNPAQKANAEQMDKPMVLTVSADGKTMTAQDTTGQAKGSLTFSRS